jgi:SAM-dependent methyltransferase
MISNPSIQCPLCSGAAKLFFEMPESRYHQCRQCLGVFMDKACWVCREDEKKRYLQHNNDVDDPRYRQFVAPLVVKVEERFKPEHTGLDYGAGTGPVAAKILKNKGYSVKLYDPYFYNVPDLLQKKYDFIICCEVIEHFNNPAKEFKLLKSLLNPGGVLFCMTDLYSEDIDFKSWYYKNDPTHVFFYQQQTLSWIKDWFGFAYLQQQKRVISFQKPRRFR